MGRDLCADCGKRALADEHVIFCWHYARPSVADIDFEMELHDAVSQRIV